MSLTLGLLVSGCALEVKFSGSQYACEPIDPSCPRGFECSDEGVCELAPHRPADAAPTDGASDPDASPDDPDDPDARPDDPAPPDAARPAPPDAASPPDAAPPPDAEVPPVTVSFGATRDTQIFSPQPNINYGNWSEIQCGRKTSEDLDAPALFAFDLPGIPTSATVVAATMRLTISHNPLGPGEIRVFELREDWVEGNQDGTPGAANYLERRPGVPWSSPGARPPSSGSTVLATFGAPTAFTSVDVPLPAELVQRWVEDPRVNHGLRLGCPDNGDASFFTRLGGSASQRPRLTVSYRP